MTLIDSLKLLLQQPADFFSVYKGRPIMLEAKTSKSYCFHYGMAVLLYQIKEGEGIVKQGGKY